MTDHYAEAERELRLAAGANFGSAEEAYGLAAAQVHATLALVDAQSKRVEIELVNGINEQFTHEGA